MRIQQKVRIWYNKKGFNTMRYLSGIHALNLKCELDTCGDWHQSAIQWERLKLYESNESLWGITV